MLKAENNRLWLYGIAIVSFLIFVIILLRAWLVPMNHDETATFFYYIQSGKFIPFYSHLDANNHVLNSALSHYSFKIFGSSPLALRLPSVFSFLFLAFSVYRIQLHLRSNLAKTILVAGLLFSFHWISFYSVTRGYGMSMSFLVLAIAFLLDYFQSKKMILFFAFVLSLQFAIAANLTLLVPILFLTGLMIIFQWINKKILNPLIFISYLLHFVALVGWVRFGIAMKEGNALYYGEGDSYWEITFRTLIELLTGSGNEILHLFIAASIILVILISAFKLLKEKQKFKEIIFDPLFIFTSSFLFLIVGFFFLHHWKDVNYLEDRTALLFYPFSILMIVFFMDRFQDKKWLKIVYILPAIFVFHFILTLNFRIQMMPEYETFPERFYTKLLEEQEKSDERITIGGHRLIELMFAMMNYNHQGVLNAADDGEEMNPYCDFGIAKKKDLKKLSKYYEVIDEADWDFVLLKRKRKQEKMVLTSIKDTNWREGEDEFIEYFRVSDTIMNSFRTPVLIEFDFDVDHAAQPFTGWLVLDITDSNGNKSSYKRIPMNWMHYSWNGTKNNRYSMISADMPEKIQTMVVYIWNQNKQFIKIRMNELKISQYKLSK